MFLISSQSVPPFFFWDLGSFLLLLLWILFQVNCLSPLHLVVILGLYLVSSSRIYSSAFSFCLIFCVCGLHSSGCRIVVLLTSGVCSLVDEVGPGACAGFQVRGTGACPLVGRGGSCPFGGQDCVKEYVYRQLWVQANFIQPICWWVGLCSHPVGGSARGVSALEPGLNAKLVTSGSTHSSEYSLGPLPPVSVSHSETKPTQR